MAGDSPAQDVILEKINNIQGDVSEIKTEVGSLNKSYQASQHEAIRERSELHMQSVASHRRLDVHEKRMKDIEDQMREIRNALQPLIFTNKILTFVGITLGGSTIALIWSLITGKAVMIIP